MPSTTPGRRPAVDDLRRRPRADVLVVGGGVNGIATFRDLALQGVDVVLVERADFVSGASSASSHMIHGGVRYLENGEFRLVRESVRERNGLLRSAPHLVRPLRTTIPIVSTTAGLLAAPLRFLTHRSSRHGERGALLVKLGLTLYDAFSRDGGSVPRHRFRRGAAVFAELPRLDRRFRWSATYFDAGMRDPERLALDVLHDGLAEGPHARAVNHVSAVGTTPHGLRLRDEVTGESLEVEARVVVNTTGPWTDQTNAALGRPSRFMGGTKGSHVVLHHDELLAACGGQEIFFEHDDGRIVLVYPLHDRVMVGTTDLEHDLTEPARCTEEEVDYFFELVARVFPDVRVGREHVVYRFSGVRPLPRHDETAPGFVSRDYRVERGTLPGGAVPVLSLVGGKWTTFRALGESLADAVLSELGRPRRAGTEGLPIGGGAGFPTDETSRTAWATEHGRGLPQERVLALLDRYGTRADAVLEVVSTGPDQPLAGAPGWSTAELAHLATEEAVVHLDDLLLRRTPLAFVGLVDDRLLEEVADVVGAALGWSDARRATELARTRELLVVEHGVSLGDVVPADADEPEAVRA